MIVEIVHIVNKSTKTHRYTCTHASRQMDADGTNIVLQDGRDETGRKVLTAQYRQAETVITYED